MGVGVCAPIYSSDSGPASQVRVGPEEGLKDASVVHCDGLLSITKNELTDFVGSLSKKTYRTGGSVGGGTRD